MVLRLRQLHMLERSGWEACHGFVADMGHLVPGQPFPLKPVHHTQTQQRAALLNTQSQEKNLHGDGHNLEDHGEEMTRQELRTVAQHSCQQPQHMAALL